MLLQIFAEMIYENENDSSGMQAVITHLHKTLVPCDDKDDPKIFGQQGIVGDQLTVESGIKSLLQLENGFTASD